MFAFFQPEIRKNTNIDNRYYRLTGFLQLGDLNSNQILHLLTARLGQFSVVSDSAIQLSKRTY